MLAWYSWVRQSWAELVQDLVQPVSGCAQGQAQVRGRLGWGALVLWAQGDTRVSTCSFVVSGMLFLLASSLGFHGDSSDIIQDLQRMALAGVYPLKSPLFLY